MADYILWGVNPKTGKNGKQEGLFFNSRHSTWSGNEADSLDELMEQPTFNEASISEIGSIRYPKKKEVFSREEALRDCPEAMRETFTDLFYRIDYTELLITFYELAHGRREKPPRAELVHKFSEEEQEAMREKISHWNQYRYLTMRHHLVELRREQYTLRDFYQPTIMSSNEPDPLPEMRDWDFDAGVEVLPLGAWHDSRVSNLVFTNWSALIPKNFAEEDLEIMSDLYWKKTQWAPTGTLMWFDFRIPEHVYALFNLEVELVEENSRKEGMEHIGHSSNSLIAALQFYVAHADLTDIQREILDMKLHKVKNTDIAWDINQKYGKTYTPNYISTIFKQRIIPKVCAAAEMHEQIIGNIFFEEEFKECTGCGRTLLRCPENFTRRARATDGYSTRCKVCEKKARQGDDL